MTPEHVKKLAAKFCNDSELPRLHFFGVPLTEIDDVLTLKRCIWIVAEKHKRERESHKLDREMRDAFAAVRGGANTVGTPGRG